jgi:hypothetical protein
MSALCQKATSPRLEERHDETDAGDQQQHQDEFPKRGVVELAVELEAGLQARNHCRQTEEVEP